LNHDQVLRNHRVGSTCKGAAVADAEANQQLLGGRFGILDEHVEVAVVIEHARVQQLIFQRQPVPLAVGPHQVLVGIRRLGILVEVLHVGMRRRAVEVEVVLLDVLAMIPFVIGQPEQTLLEDRVLPVPQRKREAKILSVVRDTCQAVLTPAIGPGASLIVAEVVPGIARLAVVLAHGPPLALAEIGTPFLPGNVPLARFRESGFFSAAALVHVRGSPF